MVLQTISTVAIVSQLSGTSSVSSKSSLADFHSSTGSREQHPRGFFATPGPAYASNYVAPADPSTVEWQDGFEPYACNAFPSTNWLLRYSGAGSSHQYVDCGTAEEGSRSLHLLGVDFTTTGTRFSALASRDFSLGNATTIGYGVFVKTGALHSPGTNEVACSIAFYVPESNVAIARVAFTDNATILPAASVHYTPATWYSVSVTVDMSSNTFDLTVNGVDKGIFTADLNGNGAYLSSISKLVLQSEHAGRDCWFDQVVTTVSGVPPPHTTVNWQDDFESYACNAFPSNWLLRYSGNGSQYQYVDCSTAEEGTRSLHLLGVDVTTTGTRWSAVADRDFSPGGATTVRYSVFVKTGAIHSPGTNEVACDTEFYVPGVNVWGVAPARVQFTDNAMIIPGNIPYTPGSWTKVDVTVHMSTNKFDLNIDGHYKGTFPADINGNGSYLSQISRFALASNHAGRHCWFDQVVVAASQPPTTGPPVASFTINPLTPNVEQTVSFNGGASYAPAGSINSYSWNFGDGSPSASGVTTTHSYAATGTYHASLTVTDSGGLTGSVSRDITVVQGRVYLSVTSDCGGIICAGLTIAGQGYYSVGSNNVTLTAPGTFVVRVFSHWIIDGNAAFASATISVGTDRYHSAIAVYLSHEDVLNFIDTAQTGLEVLSEAQFGAQLLGAARAGETYYQYVYTIGDEPALLNGIGKAGTILGIALDITQVALILASNNSIDWKNSQLEIFVEGKVAQLVCAVAMFAILDGGALATWGACSLAPEVLLPIWHFIEPDVVALGQSIISNLASAFDSIWKSFQTGIQAASNAGSAAYKTASGWVDTLYNFTLHIQIGSDVTVLLIDSKGKRLGGISSNGTVVNEMPDGIYSGLGTHPQQFTIANPLSDNYRLVFTNHASGPVSFISYGVKNGISAGPPLAYSQNLAKGDYTYQFNAMTGELIVPPTGGFDYSLLVLAAGIAFAGAIIAFAIWRSPNRLRKASSMGQRSNPAPDHG